MRGRGRRLGPPSPASRASLRPAGAAEREKAAPPCRNRDARVGDKRACPDRGLAREPIRTTPAGFACRARDPDKDVALGGPASILVPTTGAPTAGSAPAGTIPVVRTPGRWPRPSASPRRRRARPRRSTPAGSSRMASERRASPGASRAAWRACPSAPASVSCSPRSGWRRRMPSPARTATARATTRPPCSAPRPALRPRAPCLVRLGETMRPDRLRAVRARSGAPVADIPADRLDCVRPARPS
ncbi:MAG: trimethylamine methyltransferase family protein [Paracoccaceae bacterium]